MQASRHAHPLQHQPACEGGRRHLPRPLRRGAQRPDAAGRGVLVQGLGDRGRLSGIHRGGAEAARLVRRADGGREGEHRRVGGREHRPRRAGPPTSPAGSSAWRWTMAACPTATPRPAPSPGTCPTPCRCTASRSTPRAPDLVAKYPTLPDRRGFRVPHLGLSVQMRSARGRPRLPDHPDLRAGWWNTRAAARRRGPTPGWPSCSRTCSSRSTRPTPRRAASATAACLGAWAREQQPDQGQGDDHRTGRPGRRLHALSFRRLVAGRGPADNSTRPAPTRSCSARAPIP